MYTPKMRKVFQTKIWKMSFPCPKCGHEFGRNCDLTRHLNRKTPCRSEDAIIQAVTSQVSLIIISNGSESPGPSGGQNLLPLFDIARSEGIVGIDAVNHISYFLMLKLIEPHLSVEEYQLDSTNSVVPDIVRSVLEKKLHHWSNLIQVSESLLDRVHEVFFALRSNPILLDYFPNPNELKFNKTSASARRIMFGIQEIDVSGETFGDVYEDMLGRQMIGKDLGQFFTPYWVRKCVVELVNPQRQEDGTIPTICDPAAGTAGFLASTLRHLRKQGELKDVEKSIFGIEINRDTFSGGLKHLMITTKKHVPGFLFGDSLRSQPTQQFDYILSNPPFGLKGVKWDECPGLFIKANNGTSLFLQRIIQILKIGGTAGIVFPVGQEMFSGGDLMELRMLLMKCCRLDAVIKLPKQTFLNTSCSTCILMFTKMYEPIQVMSVQTKGKTQQRFWAPGSATQQVGFYEIQDVPTGGRADIKAILGVIVTDIEAKSWSLRVEDYQVVQVVREVQNNWPVYQLGQICTFKNGTNITKANLIEGPYPVVGGGQSPLGTHNAFNVPPNTIIISKDGAYAGFVSRYETPIFVSNHGIFIDVINPGVLSDYLYLVLKYNLQNSLYKLQRGMAQPGIKKENVAQLTIQVPPIEKQMEIIQKANTIFERIKLTEELLVELKLELSLVVNDL
jgi:hypothetical protein